MARFEKIAPLLQTVLALAIGSIFVYAGIIKIIDPAQFAKDIGNYRLVPWQAAAAIALYLPWLEIFCGAALIFKKFRLQLGATILLAGLCVAFVGALVSAKLRGLDIKCGCFGHTGSHSISVALVQDTMILAALIFILVREFRESRGN